MATLHAPDLPRQLLPPLLPPAFRPIPPRIKSALAHPKHLAHPPDRILLLLPLNPEILHPDSFAKNAAAFFKMSRSITSRRFSFLKRLPPPLNPASPVGFSLPSPPYFSTQFRTF